MVFEDGPATTSCRNSNPRPPLDAKATGQSSYSKAYRILQNEQSSINNKVHNPAVTHVPHYEITKLPAHTKHTKNHISNKIEINAPAPNSKSSKRNEPTHQHHHKKTQEKKNKKKKEAASSSKGNSSKSKEKYVGGYLLCETIGEGTFGKVKRGTHSMTGENVAVKILEKSKIKTEADLTRVTREIKILKTVRNENCIRLLEVIDTPKQIFLMMEYLDGGEVFDYIVQKSRLSENEASGFFGQMIDGVEYLHKMNIIHRDLKPENLLMQIMPEGQFIIKVADFGLSNTNEGNVFLKTACGSPCYAAPEMIAGKKYDGTKSDIWSLGVVLFALVCGYLPFEDNDTSALYRKILSANYKCPSFVSADFKDLLSKILNTDPVSRYTIEKIRQHTWMKAFSFGQHDNQSHRSILETVTDPSMSKSEFSAGVIDQIEKFGFDREYILQSLSKGLHNSATASYFLVAERLRQEGLSSQSDTDSERAPSSISSCFEETIDAPSTTTLNDDKSSGVKSPIQTNASNAPEKESDLAKLNEAQVEGVKREDLNSEKVNANEAEDGIREGGGGEGQKEEEEEEAAEDKEKQVKESQSGKISDFVEACDRNSNPTKNSNRNDSSSTNDKDEANTSASKEQDEEDDIFEFCEPTTAPIGSPLPLQVELNDRNKGCPTPKNEIPDSINTDSDHGENSEVNDPKASAIRMAELATEKSVAKVQAAKQNRPRRPRFPVRTRSMINRETIRFRSARSKSTHISSDAK